MRNCVMPELGASSPAAALAAAQRLPLQKVGYVAKAEPPPPVSVPVPACKLIMGRGVNADEKMGLCPDSRINWNQSQRVVMQGAISQPHIVVGLTTIPERLAKGLTRSAVQSILLQKHVPAQIVVSIPAKSHRGAPYDMKFADAIKRMAPDRITIQAMGKDEGPITKVTGTLQWLEAWEGREKKQWPGLVAFVDDDVQYRADHLGILVKGLQDQKARAVGLSGRACQPFLKWWTCNNFGNRKVDLLECFSGVLYKRDAFGPVADLRSFAATMCADAFYTDDIVIGGYLNRRGVDRIIIAHGDGFWGMFKHNPMGTPSLKDQNVDGGNPRNARVMKDMMEKKCF